MVSILQQFVPDLEEKVSQGTHLVYISIRWIMANESDSYRNTVKKEEEIESDQEFKSTDSTIIPESKVTELEASMKTAQV